MIGKILETLFRHKRLLLLPPILIPLIVGPIAYLTMPVYYETWAGIWVERPTYLKYTDDWNRNATPAQNQGDRLSQMLRTRTFLVDVARRSPLAPLAGSDRGEEQIQRIFGRDLAIIPSGTNLLAVRFRAATPELSFQVVNALVEAFKERSTESRANQAGVAIAFYGARLQELEDTLGAASDDLRRYIAANPRLATSDRGGGSGAMAASRLDPSSLDPQLAELQRRVEFDRTEVERARTALEQARLESGASQEAQELGFQVVDPPKMPMRHTAERRKALLFPAAGLVIGLGLSGALLLLLVAADRSVRSETDLAPPARVVGVVPRLQLGRIPRHSGPDAARRAIGFVAGAALSAPRGAK